MSRINEILRKLDSAGLNKTELSTHPIKTTSLWPRFEKVRTAIKSALTPNATPGIQKELKTFSWSGVDTGIHDHNGSVEGKINGIQLNIKLKGTTIDDQPQYTVQPDGTWQLQHKKENHLDISGTFESADGRNGVLQMALGNTSSQYEAYWLQGVHGITLEQIINADGLVYDANILNSFKDIVTIPGTRIELQRFRK